MTRVLLLLAVVLALTAAWAGGLWAQATPERVAEIVTGAGIAGPLVFVALFAAAEVVYVPGLLFVIAASALWPPTIAIPVAFAGALLSALVVFVLARRIVPASVRERLPERLLRFEARLETHGLQTVIAFRLVLFLAPAASWLLGASRVSFRDFFLGTAIGVVPGVIGFSWLGRRAVTHWDVIGPWAIGALALLVAFTVASASGRRRRGPHQDLDRLG